MRMLGEPKDGIVQIVVIISAAAVKQSDFFKTLLPSLLV
jgi:hypothetical protein